MFTSRYKPRKVSNIAKTDSRVALTGKVIKADENSLILDDTTGKMEIFFEGKVSKNSFIRAFCTVIGNQLKADIVQDLKDIDLNLLKKVEELYNKFGV